MPHTAIAARHNALSDLERLCLNLVARDRGSERSRSRPCFADRPTSDSIVIPVSLRELLPLGDIVLDERAQLVRRARASASMPCCLERLDHVGIGQHRLQLAVHPLDDRGRRAWPAPPRRATARRRSPCSPDSSSVGTSGSTSTRFRLVTASAFTLPARHVRQHRRHGAELDVDAAALGIEHRLRRAAVRHLGELDAGHLREQRAGEMREARRADRRVAQRRPASVLASAISSSTDFGPAGPAW